MMMVPEKHLHLSFWGLYVVLEADLDNLLLLGVALEHVVDELLYLVTGHLTNGDF